MLHPHTGVGGLPPRKTTGKIQSLLQAPAEKCMSDTFQLIIWSIFHIKAGTLAY